MREGKRARRIVEFLKIPTEDSLDHQIREKLRAARISQDPPGQKSDTQTPKREAKISKEVVANLKDVKNRVYLETSVTVKPDVTIPDDDDEEDPEVTPEREYESMHSMDSVLGNLNMVDQVVGRHWDAALLLIGCVVIRMVLRGLKTSARGWRQTRHAFAVKRIPRPT